MWRHHSRCNSWQITQVYFDSSPYHHTRYTFNTAIGNTVYLIMGSTFSPVSTRIENCLWKFTPSFLNKKQNPHKLLPLLFPTPPPPPPKWKVPIWCTSQSHFTIRQHYHLQGFILLCWNVGWFSPDVLSFLGTNGSLFTAGRPRAPVPIPRLPVVRPPTEKNIKYQFHLDLQQLQLTCSFPPWASVRKTL